MQRIILILLIFLSANVLAQTSIFNTLLQKYVDKKGNVNYKEFFRKDIKTLDSYLDYLKKTTPGSFWSENKKKAFWINAYNSYTIKLISQNYPLKSITTINKNGKNAWNIPFAEVGGKVYTLDYIEHKILREELFDSRIHVGVNCASGSCPKLHNRAFTAENINTELDNLMKQFINDSKRNRLSKKNMIYISEIFNWFKADFSKNGSVIDYINKYADRKVAPDAEIYYLPYNWNLNEK